jgi:aminopeptidase N
VKVDGAAINDWRMDGPDLLIDLPGDAIWSRSRR